MPIVVELSGGGAVSGTNFRDGLLMAIDEINAKGGILGRKIDMPVIDTQSDAERFARANSEGARQQALCHLWPGLFRFGAGRHAAHASGGNSGNRRRRSSGITEKGDPYVFRTSFGQQFSMPKIAKYLRDTVKAKTVAALWVNDDFRQGRAR